MIASNTNCVMNEYFPSMFWHISIVKRASVLYIDNISSTFLKILRHMILVFFAHQLCCGVYLYRGSPFLAKWGGAVYHVGPEYSRFAGRKLRVSLPCNQARKAFIRDAFRIITAQCIQGTEGMFWRCFSCLFTSYTFTTSHNVL